ncbi:uncharacterized protein LOC128997426 [Macrosteles quadrilineatus]|uniref:uncharacterized protein LOC128997426 n=1 Tax=Macrosteles quadrilineatus TaxID=74068 RepID=UPI0023E0C520|nr:uncharacterized protein LOC128997426 [Macrosteles quadrilineatus]
MRYSSILFAVVLVGLVKVGFSQDKKPSHHGPVFTGDDEHEPSHHGPVFTGDDEHEPSHHGPVFTGDDEHEPSHHGPVFTGDDDDPSYYGYLRSQGKSYGNKPTKPRPPPHKGHYRTDEFIDDNDDHSIISNEDEFTSQDNTSDLSDNSLEDSYEFAGDVFEFFP